MIIKDLFTKPIEREIQGVIIVGQNEAENIHQELDEYVVTNELEKHFRDFFEAYMKGFTGNTTKVGIWISGFFGSGKSHFLKILSYILENKDVDGKKAIDFFKDGNKLHDTTILANMTRVAQEAGNSDIILFNIDSKSKNSAKINREPIVSVFLRVFNEMQGFSANPHVAELERNLLDQNKLEDFKNEFKAITGKEWAAGQNQFGFLEDKIVTILAKIGVMSEEAARNLFKGTKTDFTITKEEFAARVKEYIDKNGGKRHVVFMVDEMGQYIGQDSNLMLDLQTITEEFGKTCQGKAWVVVTSQEDIDSITENMAQRSNDFSKIQGRFDTRLTLSSSDVAEVIRKRILEKTDTAKKTLDLIYQGNETVLKNLIVFSDATQKKLYSDAGSFTQDYPFIPYQFDLLRHVLTAVRENGASGKHLAQGERSMLALFKESAVKIDKCETGPLVPFNFFYDALDKFLDTGITNVIDEAKRNDRINPKHEADCFAVNVLKTLFLIKYLDNFASTLDNITSLMCASIDEKRLPLQDKIEEALKSLISQALVSKKGDIYIFLTNEEQAINKEIDRQNVQISDVREELGKILFDGIIGESKYKLPEHNGRYVFDYAQKIDDYQHSRHLFPVILQILTPYSGIQADDASLHMQSSQTNGALVILGQTDKTYLEEIERYLKTEKYLKTGSTPNFQKGEQIKNLKREENNINRQNADQHLRNAIGEARIFVNGNETSAAGKDIKSRVRTALEIAIRQTYNKLPYITQVMDTAKIRNLFSPNADQLIADPAGVNKDALDDMKSFISDNTNNHQKTSMKKLQDRFMAPPYGFVEADVEWLCAKLFKDGDINIYISGQQISIQDKTASEFVDYFTNKKFTETLLAEIRQKADDTQLKTLRDIIKALYSDSAQNDDEDELIKKFKDKTKELIGKLEDIHRQYDSNPAYPGKDAVENGLAVMRQLAHTNGSLDFFTEIKAKKDDILDFAEDYGNIANFFSETGSQKAIFSTAVNVKKSFDQNKIFIAGDEIPAIASEIAAIIESKAPYANIHKLPDLNNRFTEAMAKLCDKEKVPLLLVLEESKNVVIQALSSKSFKDELNERFIASFNEEEHKIQSCRSLFEFQGLKSEIDKIKISALNAIAAKESEKQAAAHLSGEQQAMPKGKKTKHVGIKSLSPSVTWRIETEDDIDTCLALIKLLLLKELNDETIIQVEL
ncbi:BREX system P-loop protein BrxC [Treponema primitia]|uniref:BREX system P-loop protein BrxC n=1 Tax=Treponema primitia TaxID=88058 RepID=UPI00397F12AD